MQIHAGSVNPVGRDPPALTSVDQRVVRDRHVEARGDELDEEVGAVGSDLLYGDSWRTTSCQVR
jgi:hypothetical protein